MYLVEIYTRHCAGVPHSVTISGEGIVPTSFTVKLLSENTIQTQGAVTVDLGRGVTALCPNVQQTPVPKLYPHVYPKLSPL
jgi:hypothetical protein